MAIYIAVSAVASLSYWAQIGAGPALTQRISKANAVGDKEEIRLQIHASLVLVLTMAAACCVLGGVFLASGGFTHFYGLEDAASSSQRLSFLFVLFFSAYNLIVSPILRAQTGLHQTYFKNWLNSAGNVVILGLLLFILPKHPFSVWALTFMFGPIALIDLLNAVLFIRQFKFILKWSFVPDTAIKAAIWDSLAYTIFELSFVVVRELTKGYVGRSDGQDALARFGLMLQASIILQALSNTVVIPLLPVFTDLIASKRTAEFKQKFLSYGALFCGAVTVAGAILLLTPLNPLAILFHKYHFSRLDNLAFLILGFSNIFRFYCGFVFYSLGKMWNPAIFSCVGATAAGLAAVAFRAGSVGQITLAFGLAGCLVYVAVEFPFILRSIDKMAREFSSSPPSPG